MLTGIRKEMALVCFNHFYVMPKIFRFKKSFLIGAVTKEARNVNFFFGAFEGGLNVQVLPSLND